MAGVAESVISELVTRGVEKIASRKEFDLPRSYCSILARAKLQLVKNG
jgi:hypothetical protein